MTIVHIGPPHLPILYTLGGATERRIRELAARQAQTGSRVVVYSAEDCAGVTDYEGAEIRALRCTSRGVLRAAEFLVKALRDTRSVRPDVIHFHSLAEGAALARGLGARTVLSYDFYMFRRGKENPLFPLYRRALKRFSLLLPVSDYCRRESADYWSLPAGGMRVVYNGVNTRQFAPNPDAGAEMRQRLGLNGDFVLTYVGRVCRQKGTDLLIDAYARLRSEGRKIRLVVAGPIGQFGHEGGNELTQSLQRHGGVYLGPVDEVTLPRVYNMCDVFVMATRAYEMFGMSALEAQACGKPVVCSDNGGLPEVISRDSGMLFRAGDSGDLADRLRTMMDNAELRSRFSAAAVHNALRFSWETIAADLNTAYEQAAT